MTFGAPPTTPVAVTAGTTDETNISINDDNVPQVTVNFEQSSYTVAEDSRETVKVTLSADPERTVAILINKSYQDGASNIDYSGVPGSVTFNSGDTEKTFSFIATQDTVDDEGESVNLTFGAMPTGVTEGATNEAMMHITDDDKPTSLTVNFGSATYSVGEGVNVTVMVT